LTVSKVHMIGLSTSGDLRKVHTQVDNFVLDDKRERDVGIQRVWDDVKGLGGTVMVEKSALFSIAGLKNVSEVKSPTNTCLVQRHAIIWR
jgi:hypothetical protein